MQALDELCQRLAAEGTNEPNIRQRLSWCAEAGVFRWFVPKAYEGWEWTDAEQIEGYLTLSQACLTTAFVLTQWNAACKRIVLSQNAQQREQWLPAMARGEVISTVGISHLTTSRQHVSSPVLKATEQSDNSWLLDGFSPWVTAAPLAQMIVVGATAADGRQILCAVPTSRDGVAVGAGVPLVALSASATDAVHFRNVRVHRDEIIAGPVHNVMQQGAGGGTGGLQTSTLAIGLSLAAVKFLQTEAVKRPELQAIADKLAADAHGLAGALMLLAGGGGSGSCATGLQSGDNSRRTGSQPVDFSRCDVDSSEIEETNRPEAYSTNELRERANSLVLRATQSALVAAKGAGFVDGHPVGRWCREALFFLVWSCPQPVLAANLCEFAQV